MAGSVYTRTFLLLVSIAGAHGYTWIGRPGNAILLFAHYGHEVDVMYRVHEDGDLLLANCSQPDSPQPDGYNVTCGKGFYHTFTPSSVSQTGHYRLDGWTSGNITHQQHFQLIICAQEMATTDPSNSFTPVPSERVADESGAELCFPNVTLGNSTTLRVYRYGERSPVLDSSSSLEPLVEDLKGRLQLDLNSSRVTLHDMSAELFICTIWREDQCLSYGETGRRYEPHLFTHEGKNVTLPCISNDTTINRKLYWATNAGQLRGRVSVNRHNYTLTISNLTAEDSAVFTWRQFPGDWLNYWWCKEGSIRLVYRDAFGVHSPFYRAYGPLLGCVLLGLVAAVIWLRLRSRRGMLNPGGQEMEMQDIGGEDAPDEVEEVLTPGVQEMEMQDIGDQDVYDDAEGAEDTI